MRKLIAKIKQLPELSIDDKLIRNVKNGDILKTAFRYYVISDLKEPKVKAVSGYIPVYITRTCLLTEIGNDVNKFAFVMTNLSIHKIILRKLGEKSIYKYTHSEV